MDFVSQSFDFTNVPRCIVIGEIGVNHNAREDYLFKLIDEGITAGLDVIKFQRFNAALEISQHAALANYQNDGVSAENQLKMAQNLELPDELLVKAFEYCKEKGVGFLCTAFERESVDFLADKLGVSSVKVASPELSNKPLLKYMAQKFEALLVSTGASYMEEVERAVDWIGCDKELVLMHCTSQYPASLEQANLKAVASMKEHFELPVGYSDHTVGTTAAVAAVALGAAVVEKHYTLDKSLPGPDHKASADIEELKAYVRAVKEASASIGDGVKKPADEEEETRPKIRKSVVCGVEILSEGTVLTPEMIEIKRPWVDGAVEPFDLDQVLGKALTKKKSFDEPILWSDFKG